jgi:hypothetical protein
MFTLVIGLTLALAACASPVSAPAEPTSAEPTDAPPVTEAAESEAPAETEAGDDGAGGDGEAPALADGPWSGGEAHITVSGGVSLTIDEQLTTDLSHTDEAKTQLVYNTDTEFVTFGINYIGVPFNVSITGEDFSVSGEPGCEVTYDRADDTGIEGTFSCPMDEFYWYSAEEEPTDPVTIEGSFTATR